MRAAWRAADVRAAEEELMSTQSDGTLMQRAATGLARRCASLLAERGGVYGRRVLLLVGAGNNGGDALFAGAALARRGAVVDALLLSPDRVHREGLGALRAAGGSVVDSLDADVDMVVDGIVGIGAKGALRGAAAELVEKLADLRTAPGDPPLVVSVDVPSGVDVDTGAVNGPAVRADVTVTFGCLKPALVVGPAAPLAGHVDLVDIGLPWLNAPPAVWVPDAADIARWWPHPVSTSDKYTRGVVGVATGSTAYPGAALMSVAGALAGPVGMVRYAGAVASDVALAHPSVVVSPRVASAGRVQAWLCGCGLGTDERAQDELRAVLGSSVPVILDADALTLLSDGGLSTWLRQRVAPTVVTPHDREFARIAGETGRARPGAGHAPAREPAADRGPSEGRPYGRRHTRRHRVGQSDRNAGAGHRGHRRCARRPAGVAARGRVARRPGGAWRPRSSTASPAVARSSERGGEPAPITAPDVAAALPAVIASLG